jgi:hypothetical protein
MLGFYEGLHVFQLLLQNRRAAMHKHEPRPKRTRLTDLEPHLLFGDVKMALVEAAL